MNPRIEIQIEMEPAEHPRKEQLPTATPPPETKKRGKVGVIGVLSIIGALFGAFAGLGSGWGIFGGDIGSAILALVMIIPGAILGAIFGAIIGVVFVFGGKVFEPLKAQVKVKEEIIEPQVISPPQNVSSIKRTLPFILAIIACILILLALS